jgi:predicted ArsR family transcriptional regulator
MEANCITVDQKTLRSLGADTRVSILKQLSGKPMTQTELAAELKISPPAVNAHLHNLAEVSLVRQVDSQGRKWKYYELSEKGEAIIRPEGARTLMFTFI